MDPTNTNQNDNQAPAVSSAPVSPVTTAPESPVMDPVSVAPEMPVAPEPPVMPEAPAAPVDPAAPEVSVAPEVPVIPEAPAAPEAPVAPTASAMPTNPNVAMPAIDPSLVEQASGVAVEVSDVMVGATDPITMPNPPKAPDPVEEELKAPMTAAAPVPGSIGSAISMPAEQTTDSNEAIMNGIDMNAAPRTPNVAFNDPASSEANQGKAANPVAPAKKKIDKKTLIMLCGVAGIAVVALVIVLAMMMNQ